MSLTNNQNIPTRESEVASPWTARPLLSVKKTVQTVIEKYNAFEIIFFVMILLTAFAILINRYIPWAWYIFLFFVMIIALKNKDDLALKQKTDVDTGHVKDSSDSGATE